MERNPLQEYTYLTPHVSSTCTPGSSSHNLGVPTEYSSMDHTRSQEDPQDRSVTGTGQPKCTSDQVDSYTQGIELSNACRRFYVTRVQVAEGMKMKLNTDLASSGSRTLDVSMGTLRKEVVSLIDQDLTLMRQLLTLNERIEELKWHRKFAGYSPTSMTTSASSGNMLNSDANILSDWDTDNTTHYDDRLSVPKELEGEREGLHSKYLSPSNLSLFRECVYNSAQDNLHEILSSAGNASVTSRLDMTQSRTSDLGSSDELVNSVSDIRKARNPNRFSKADSCISSDCTSNSSSLKKSDTETSALRDMGTYVRDNRINSVVQTIPTIDIRVHIDNDDEDDDDLGINKYSHDSGIQDDHNLEMII